jgi:sugar/nucleoside kinase (ribokinase family)
MRPESATSDAAPADRPVPSRLPAAREHVAVAAGHICLDLMPSFGTRALDFRPGDLRIAGPLTISTGGSVSNTGIALHRLGVRTRLVALAGDDPLGEVLRATLERESEGLGDGIVVREGVRTSYSVILSSAVTDRIVLHDPGANDDFLARDVSEEALRGAELLHFGYPPLMRAICASDGAELAAILGRAQQLGLATSLDMAEPDERAGAIDWRALLTRVLPVTDIFLPSIGELRTMLGRPDAQPGPLAEECLALGARVAGIKLGPEGIYLRTASAAAMRPLAQRLPGLDAAAWSDRELWAPVFEVTVRGTTGSGDTTIAGFVTGILERLGPEDALNLGCAAGSLCVESDDAVSGIGSRHQAAERMASSLARPPAPTLATWTRLPSGVFAGPADRR